MRVCLCSSVRESENHLHVSKQSMGESDLVKTIDGRVGSCAMSLIQATKKRCPRTEGQASQPIAGQTYVVSGALLSIHLLLLREPCFEFSFFRRGVAS